MKIKMIKWLSNNLGHPVFMPFYHVVNDEELPHIKHLYPVKKVNCFINEIDYLLKYFTPISLEELFLLQQGQLKKANKPYFFLSFDDGFSQCYDIIAPILLKKGVPATFFINSGFVDNKDLMFRNKLSLLLAQNVIKSKSQFSDYGYKNIEAINELALSHGIDFAEFLKMEKPYMTMVQVNELEKQGFTFGGHSHNHPYYKDISLKDQINQTVLSLDYIKENLNQKISAFAFPFDDIEVENSFFNSMSKRVDVFFTSGGIKNDELNYVFRRVDMEHQSDIANFMYRIYAKTFLKKIIKYRHIHRRGN